jgi:hypothetical protein
VPFTDHPLRRVGCRMLALLTLGLVACAPPRPPAPSTPAAPQRPPTAALGAPAAIVARARNWDEYRLRAAHRLAAANADRVYSGPVPEPLLAIPVLEIELNADGSVRHIIVQREPSQAKDTVQLAIDAVRRAAPFGQVSHLPRPWKFSEVFLFDDDRKFKPRLLDQ